ncbi:MAG TPA: GNAT family N-acetyltransferase [Kofleriaceae bacterium]|jgi:ribosomal protein S18 acetylase RimI-like enzyme|nr:GNAT family N-acetyltransferase [Kofleriaceae bacterium]
MVPNVRAIERNELALVQRLHERCADFWTLVEGEPPRPGLAEELMHEVPPGGTIDHKHVLGAFDAELVALLDLYDGYPEPHAWYVSLLLVAPEARGGGLGHELVAYAEAYVRARGGRALRLIVQEQNPRALAFWMREGFVYEATTTQKIGRPNVVTRLVKPLSLSPRTRAC